MTSAHEQLLHDFKQKHFGETPTPQHGITMPKPDKVLEWALISIVEQLSAINTHLARLQRKS